MTVKTVTIVPTGIVMAGGHMERRNGPGKFSKLFYEDEMCENFKVFTLKEKMKSS